MASAVVDIRADPFWGLLCFTCNTGGKPLSSSGRSAIPASILDHLKMKHPTDNSNDERQMNERDRIALSCKSELRHVADQQCRCGNPQQERLFLGRYLRPVQTVEQCMGCLQIKTVGYNRRGRHLKQCVPGSVFQAEGTQVQFVKAGGNKLKFVPVGYDPKSLLHLHRFYVGAIRSSVHFEAPQPPNPIEVPLESQMARQTGQPMPPIVHTRPSRKFHEKGISKALFEGFKEGVRLSDEYSEHREIFYHEIELNVMKGACQPILVDFVLELYEDLVVRHYEGRWVDFGDSMTSLVNESRTRVEERIVILSKQLFEELYSHLRSINGDFRTSICQVGSYRPRSKLFALVDRLKSIVGDNQDEGLAEEEGGTHFAAPDDNAKNEVFDELVSFCDETQSSAGIPRGLSQAGCDKTRIGYSHSMAEYVIFLFRLYGEDLAGDPNTKKMVNDMKAGLFSSPFSLTDPLSIERAKGFIMTLVIASLGLTDSEDYGEMVAKRYADAELYCLAKALLKTHQGKGRVLFNFKGPASLHGAASRIFYDVRLTACGACLHAYRTDDGRLQNLFPSADVFIQSRTWRALARLQKVARSYEGKIEEGIEPASISKSSEELLVPDTFTIKHPSRGGVVLVTRTMLANATRRSHDSLSEMTVELLSVLSKTKIVVRSIPSGVEVELDLSKDHNWDSLKTSLLSSLPNIQEPGHVWCLTHKSQQPDGRFGNEVYGSTVSARYSFAATDGSLYEVDSITIAKCLAGILECNEVYLQTFVSRHQQYPTIFGTLFLYVLRGAPRDTEILRFRTGVTNKFGSASMKSDLCPHNTPGTASVDELLVRFQRNKYGTGGQGQSGLLLLPSFLTLALVNYLSIFRTAMVLHMSKTHTEMGELYQLSTHLYKRVELRSDGLHICSWGQFSGQIQSYVNSTFGLAKDTLTIRMLRQVVSAVGQVLDNDNKRLKKASIHRTRANAFNHTQATHDRYYSEAIRLDETRIAKHHLDVGREMDVHTHDYYGCPVIHKTVTTASSIKGWRRLRLFDDRLAHALLKLGGQMNYKKIVPFQREFATEVTSSCRDAIFVYPCGSGKSAIAYMLVVYSFACMLARTDETEHLDLLERRLSSGTFTAMVEATGTLARQILEDRDVKALLHYCRRDPCPPPTRILNIVVAPYRAVVQELIHELNAKQLIRAVEFSAYTLGLMVQKVERGGLGGSGQSFEVDIMVMTASMAVREENRIVLEAAMKSGMIGCQVVDEVHTCLTNIEWMTDVSLLRNTRRYGVPIFGMTGTLQSVLQLEIAQVLSSNVGTCTMEAQLASTRDAVHKRLGAHGTDEVIDQWRKRKGQYRAANTMPTNIGVVFHRVEGNEMRMIAKAVSMANFSRLRSGNHTGMKAERCLILCATRTQATKVHEFVSKHRGIQEAGCSLLMGREDKATIEKFDAEFTRGTNYLGVTTSVGAQSLNNKHLNLVIILSMSYSVQLVCQAMARAGRRGQKSIAVYLHHDEFAKRCMEHLHEPEFSFVEANACGVDINNVEVRRALSPVSLFSFVQCKPSECLWGKLRDELDSNSGSYENHRDEEWCCGNCCPEIQRYFDEVLSAPNSWGTKVAEAPPVKRRRLIASNDLRRAAETAGRQVRVSTPARTVVGAVPAHRTLLTAVERRHHPSDGSYVRSLVTANDTVGGNARQCCIWHQGLSLHGTRDNQIFKDRKCRATFCLFLGMRGGISCYKCGGLPVHCGGGGGKCRLEKFDRMRFSMATNSCLRCGVCHGVGEWHKSDDCPNDRIWGLVVWAYRSVKGYRAVNKQWKENYASTDQAFPDRIDFVMADEVLIQKWVFALKFMMLHESRNLKFWTCVHRALQKEGFIKKVS